ncbi:protein UL49 [macacine betaherpesvirus 9]|uniref:Protein UL49 n=1 Tax=macacine betaherpesvirus 9 TaxID=2560568 RepID=A0A192XNV5_9BETA|nr:protein UL49 [macacine betaherpesvirus 9]ANC96546.1 protein UL49 [macacine betaherpesvirus 9]
MYSLKRLLCQLLSPLCKHGPYKHLQLFLMGNDQKNTKCMLSIFITNKKFLNKELTDFFYRKFLKLWLNCDLYSRNQIKFWFNRMVMTKNFFLFLAYLYFVYIEYKILDSISIYKMQRVSWNELKQKIYEYPVHKLNALLEVPSFACFNDLHLFIFGQQLMLPISTHCNVPCVKIFCLKNYDQCQKIFLRYSHDDANVNYENLLHASSLIVPSGNFMFAMARAIIENFCYESDKFLIPLDNNSLVPIIMNTQGKNHPKILTFALATVLKNSLTSSLISLPVFCYCKTKCLRYFKNNSLVAVICSKCGHCLNSGKEKLKGMQMFSLNSLFYYRDKQEKNLIHSMHTDLLHCSLCGGQRLVTEKIYELCEYRISNITVRTVNWKAIIGTNSACTILNESIKFDAIVGCSCRTCYSTIHLYNITITKLLKLITHASDFQCQECQYLFRETCLDLEDCTEICSGCEIYKFTKCVQK